MKKAYRKWTPQQKEKILLEIKRIGVVAGCRKHNISPRAYYDWLDKYSSGGLDALEKQTGKNTQLQLKRLQKENKVLKELLAEKELEARLKDDLLKKRCKHGTTKTSGEICGKSRIIGNESTCHSRDIAQQLLLQTYG